MSPTSAVVGAPERADRIEPRAVAVRSIATRIAARDCHVLAAHPGAGLTELAIALSELPDWIAFADVGGRQVLRAVTLAELLIAHVTRGAAAVALVPVGAVDRERLETILGRRLRVALQPLQAGQHPLQELHRQRLDRGAPRDRPWRQHQPTQPGHGRF